MYLELFFRQNIKKIKLLLRVMFKQTEMNEKTDSL